MGNMAELTTKQRLFVEAYLANPNATEAARRAGYSEKTARSQGQRLLTNVDIAEALKGRVEEAAITANEWLTEVTQLARTAERDADRLTAYGLLGKPLNLTNSTNVNLKAEVEIEEVIRPKLPDAR